MINTEDRKAVAAAFSKDMNPETGGHIFRLVIGSVLVLVGLAEIIKVRIIDPQPWEVYGALVNLSIVGAGLLIMFTGTIMDFIRVFPFHSSKALTYANRSHCR